MRLSRFVFILAGFAWMLLSSGAVLGQVAPVAPRSTGIGVAAPGCSETEIAQKPAIEPYTAIRKTSRVQQLANGATITHETTAKEARDSSGRTFHENRPEVPEGAEGPVRSFSFSFFNVFDPVNRISINWNSNSKEATVTHMPEPNQARSAQIPRPAVQTAVLDPSTPAVRLNRPRPQMEDLGTKTINGVEAKGTRTTTIIPAGQVGNDQPLTVVHETWMSPELRLPVLQITDDPRTGVTTMELTEIERGEPDPALFHAPEGYTVKERFPDQQN